MKRLFFKDHTFTTVFDGEDESQSQEVWTHISLEQARFLANTYATNNKLLGMSIDLKTKVEGYYAYLVFEDWDEWEAYKQISEQALKAKIEDKENEEDNED